MNELEKYNNQDIFNPEYLYHGSPYIMEKIEPREAKDSVNKENEDTAVFLTSYQPTALAYAFRNKIKEKFPENFKNFYSDDQEVVRLDFPYEAPEKISTNLLICFHLRAMLGIICAL